MREYYAVEIITANDDYWVEVEICDNKTQAKRFYDEWVAELSKENDHFNIRIVSKQNHKQLK
jgi:hypothetical protein